MPQDTNPASGSKSKAKWGESSSYPLKHGIGGTRQIRESNDTVLSFCPHLFPNTRLKIRVYPCASVVKLIHVHSWLLHTTSTTLALSGTDVPGPGIHDSEPTKTLC